MVRIKTTLRELAKQWLKGSRASRVECPITVYQDKRSAAADAFHATHLYWGYGKIRLERIEHLDTSRKGFQGVAFLAAFGDEVWIED